MGHGTNGRETPPARLTMASATAIAATLQALTAPSRLMILSQLRQAPATVGELTRAVRMEQSAVSHQLRLLRAMGLVATQRNGRSITYSLYDDHVASLLDEAVYHAEHVRLGDSASNAEDLINDEANRSPRASAPLT
ncbi:DNA-binding transcriptional ArsR family regulator [Nakamurella sp. UYEF19]|uniref:ArsR/SmtB family transcription factor n=1 Tax=Nakamurella sp. UYEF19 TaxID=1756392 RepID=UPI0033925654